MSNHQKEKEAGIAEFIGPLLKRLKQAKERVPENSRMEKFIDQISIEVVKTRDIIDCREKLDRELVGYFGKIERQIDPLIDRKPREKAYDLPKKDAITEVGESSNTSYQEDIEVSKFQEFMETRGKFGGDPWERNCLMSLVIFPENTELKKRFVIYWWITICYWKNTEHLERLISNLVNMKVIIPVHRKHNKVIDRFTIKSKFRKWLISNHAKYTWDMSEKREEGPWCLHRDNTRFPITMLLNLDQRYLNSKDIRGIIGPSKRDFLGAIQLGRWHYTETEIQKTGLEKTKSNDHIEVDQTDFFQKLGMLVSYLSLQGISGIVELPQSVGKLRSLKILDLRACHNLEKLPQKSRSTLLEKLCGWERSEQGRWFNLLCVLDISQCYLLDHMPKWICELYGLKVLKGIVVGSLGNKKQSCRLCDLSKLNKLQKLSIRFATGIFSPKVFQGFNSLDSLLILTITWGENKYKKIPTYSLPKNLEKLDIRCYPEAEASKLQNWGELTKLKRLYIRGGYLTKVPCHNNWRDIVPQVLEKVILSN